MNGWNSVANIFVTIFFICVVLALLRLVISSAFAVSKIAEHKKRLVGTRFILSKQLNPHSPIKAEMQGVSLILKSDKCIAAGSWARVVGVKGNTATVSALSSLCHPKVDETQ